MQEIDIEIAENWLSPLRNATCEHEDVKVIWNEGDGNILVNRPDIVIKKRHKIGLLIDVALLSGR
jgi:hypothetical protein